MGLLSAYLYNFKVLCDFPFGASQVLIPTYIPTKMQAASGLLWTIQTTAQEYFTIKIIYYGKIKTTVNLNPLLQAKSTFINFRKETADIYAQSTMTDEEYFVYQTNRQIEEWEKQGQSRADIDERVNALLLQRNNKYSADFGKMWEETYNRVDQAGADML